MNPSNIDFVYQFEQLARFTERLPVVGLLKKLEKPSLIPARVWVSCLRAPLFMKEETKTVWKVREQFNLKYEQRIEGPPARACYEVDEPAIENCCGFSSFSIWVTLETLACWLVKER